MIREVSGTTTNSYVYGLDLSGTAQGAGTIGGILSASFGGTTSVSSAFYCYDANGNVTDLVGTNGEFLAQYQYDPYGNTISKSGALADVNPFRFSTKYLDAETGLYYYGYRFYNPEIGRWASRDPSSEKGGLNLYGTVWNSPIRYADPLGLAPQLCGIDSNGMPIYCDDPPPCHGHCPPPTDPGAECLDVPGLPADSSECDLYGDRRYLGTSLKCFCKCAGDSDWSKKVRGCLRCMDKKGVDPFEAHIRCYQTASNAGYDRPNIRIGCCYVSCLRGGR
jgi:RHS repeat-associated protein